MRRAIRTMREHGILVLNRSIGLRGSDVHDRMITNPDEMRPIGLIGYLTNEGHAAAFVVIDHSSSECLGVGVARRCMRFEAPT